MVDQRASHGVISLAPDQACMIPARSSGDTTNADIGKEPGGVHPDVGEIGGGENLRLQPLLGAEAKDEIHFQAGILGVGQLGCAIVPVCGGNDGHGTGRGGGGGGRGAVMLLRLAPRRGVANWVEIWEGSDDERARAEQLKAAVLPGERKAASQGSCGHGVGGVVVIIVVVEEEMVEGGGACHIGCACGGWGRGRGGSERIRKCTWGCSEGPRNDVFKERMGGKVLLRSKEGDEDGVVYHCAWLNVVGD